MRAYSFRNFQLFVVFFLMMALSAYGFFLYRIYGIDSEAVPTSDPAVQVMSPSLGNENFSLQSLLPETPEDDSPSEAASTMLSPSLNGEQEMAAFRLERERQRSATMAELKTLLEDKNLSNVQRDTFQNKLVRLYEESEQELKVEQLLQSKGFDGAVLMRGEQNYTVIVPRSGLTSAESIQVAELVARATGISANEIVIVERAE